MNIIESNFYIVIYRIEIFESIMISSNWT